MFAPPSPGAALPRPRQPLRAGVKNATKVTNCGGGRVARAQTHPAARVQATIHCHCLSLISSARLPTPFHVCAQREKKNYKPLLPSFFLSLFSLFFLFRTRYSPPVASKTCAHFSPPGLSFSLFPRGAKKWGRNPFPSPDLFPKTRVSFLPSLDLGTFILTRGGGGGINE